MKTLKVLSFIALAAVLCSCGGGKEDKPDGPITPSVVAVSSVSLSKTEAELVIGNTLQLTATVSPSNATEKNITWNSSNTTIATITPTGLVTAKAEGSANITASCGGKSATCKLTVKKPIVAVTSVELDKPEITLDAEETYTLKATVKPDNATDKTVTWASSKPDIATVDNNGKVTGVNNGIASVTATSGGKSASCKVNVVVKVKSITLSQTSATIAVGQEPLTLTATISPDNAADKTITWTTSDASVATVNNGKVTAVNIGTATITAKAGDKTATCDITVAPTPVTSVTLNQTSASLKVGETVTLTATVNPSDATDKTVTWTTSDATVATVNNGVVTAVKVGSATITATAGDKSATCEITVAPTPVTSVTLSQTSASLKVGETVTLTATVLPDDATDKTVTWKSSNTGVATVDNGVVKGVGAGSVTITATAGNVSATCTILVVIDSADGVSARYYGGSISSINGKIQNGSKLNFGVVNYSTETIRVVSVQLIDGQTGVGGNVMSIGADIASGSSSAWTITIGVAGIYDPTAKFTFTFKGETYTCEAKYVTFF